MVNRVLFALTALILLLLSPTLPQSMRAASSSSSDVWVKTWGGAGLEFASCLQRDSSGNVYTVGPTNSFEGGLYRNVILKYNSSGNLLWQRVWGTPNADDKANPCGIDSQGNLYVAGYTQLGGNDCYAWPSYGNCTVTLLKLNSTGSIAWQKDWGGNASNVPHGVVVDAFDNIYVSGFYETSGTGEGVPQAFLLKFNSTGSLLWQKSWGGLRGDNGNGLGTDTSGNVYLTGYTNTFGDGSGDIFVLKISPDGNLLWERAWGLTSFDEGFWVTTDGSDNVYVTGRTGSFKSGPGGDVVLLKFNATGSLLWQKVWGPTGSSVVDSSGGELALDASGNIYITGGTGSSPYDTTTWDLLILEFDSQGKLLQQTSFGALGNDGASGLKLNNDSSMYISGHVSEPPPYNLTTLNYSTISPMLGVGTPTIPLRPLTFNVTALNGYVTSVTGTETYGGGMDALLLKCKLTCGNGTITTTPDPPAQLMVFPMTLVSLTTILIVAAIVRRSRFRRDGYR